MSTGQGTAFQSSRWFPLADREYALCQKKFTSFLDGHKYRRYLDIGCNEGRFTLECARAAGAEEVYGIEIDPDIAARARERGIDVRVLDAGNRYPFPDNCFELVTMNQLLEHVLDTDRALSECFRVLDHGGRLLISSPNLCSLFQRMLVLAGMQPTTLHVSKVQVGNFMRGTETRNEHVHAFAMSALADLLQYHGFKIVQKAGSGFYPIPPPVSTLAANLFPGLAVYTIIAARKI